MAKYTETFAEYLSGGRALPAAFADISGFEDLFVGEFCDKEIGFETEDLFEIKLDARASLVIPVYAEKIAQLSAAYEAAASPAKKYTTTLTAGAQSAESYALPANSQEALPNARQSSDPYTNTDERIEEGFTPDEAIKYAEFVRNRKNTLEACLREFDNLFMRVY